MTTNSVALFVPFALVGSLVVAGLCAQGVPIGFAEDFALSQDRGKVLEQLVPGTEEDSFYRCLDAQNRGALDEVPPLLKTWIERYGRTPRVVEIENRQALLRYDRDPTGTMRFLQQRLGLSFSHQRQAVGEKPDLPTALDPEILSMARLWQRALERHPGSVDGFRRAAYPALAAADLDDALLMSLLQRLERPDLPGLPALIARNLQSRQSRGFGSLPIHLELLQGQLEELLALQPDLLNDDTFVDVYLRRLVPNDDVDAHLHADAERAYLDRLQAFAQRLAPSHNSLKAHVLDHRLWFDLQHGVVDQDRFLAYLRLPRPGSYVEPRLLQGAAGQDVARPDQSYPTGYPPIQDDEPLVRAYLSRLLVDADSIAPYAPFIRSDYLERLFAETKILAGVGDMERWYSLLDDPAYYQKLVERVELDFAPDQPQWIGADEPVAIDVDVKNVDTLLIKVFEINTLNWYRDQQKEVDASIDLDGLVANTERTVKLDENPVRRVRRHFPLPSVRAPGVYVVELIGNGIASRAVIHKGRLQLVERPGAAGHFCRVLDEAGTLLKDASIWFGSREYRPDDDGVIVLPYSTDPGTKPVVLQHGRQAALARLDHEAERYDLAAGVHVDREALLPGRKATLLLRPTLLLNGRAIALSELDDAVLAITAVDRDGTPSSLEKRGLALHADAETPVEITVPESLASLQVQLRGRVDSLTRDEPVDVASAMRTFPVNGIDGTEQTACPLLGRTPDGYVLDVLGKSGEPRADQAVTVVLEHEEFTDPISVALKTDAAGRIRLGTLPGIVAVSADGFGGGAGRWDLHLQARTWPDRVHGVAGETVVVPWPGGSAAPTRATVSLLETRDGTFVRDAFEHLAVAGGFLELRDLEPGDYDLALAEPDRHILVAITAGAHRYGWAMGEDRWLELPARPPLGITDVQASDDTVTIRLAHQGPGTRVHVVASRYLPAFDPLGDLQGPDKEPLHVVGVEHPETTYHSGREIGSEARYVLERRFATKFAGNMLPRPGLLLNPWAWEQWTTAVGLGGGAGGHFGAEKRGGSHGGRDAAMAPNAQAVLAPGTFANLAFLPEGSHLLANLRPDAQGVVTVPRAALGDGQLVQVVATDDDDTVLRTLTLPERPLQPKSRGLLRGFDPQTHFVPSREIELVAAGGQATIADATTARVETYDSLAAVLRLFRALTHDGTLAEFAPLLRWPRMTDQERRDFYSQHACHELNFFLWHKDRRWFDAVVRPYLENKLAPRFMDEWLLERDLRHWLEPRAYARLNIVERILLAQRLPAEADAIARQVADLDALHVPDPDQQRRWFESLLGAAALEPSATTALVAGERLRADQKAVTRERTAGGRYRGAGDAVPPAATEPAQEVAEDELAEKPETAFDSEAWSAAKGGLLGGGGGGGKYVDRRAEVRRLYRAPEPTKMWVENDYWQLLLSEQDADLVTANGFWSDYARFSGDGAFLSAHVAEATGSFTEMMLALAVLDLPFTSDGPTSAVEDGRLTVTTKQPLLLVREEIVAAESAAQDDRLLVTENFFRLDDRYRYENGERHDVFVDEFLAGIAYGCQVVVTNPTSTPQRLDLLLQVPQGAVPVNNGFYTKGMGVQLAAFSTQALEYAFYFPAIGTRAHYPVHASRDGKVVAFAPPETLQVVAQPSTLDTTSWTYVSQNGSLDDVLHYLDAHNLYRVDLTQIAWRMRDRAAFDAVIALLRQRHVYADVLWSYGIHHRDADTTREYLRHRDEFLNACGEVLDSPLLTIDPVERRTYQHIEFEPLFHARAHRFGRQWQITNRELAAQYLRLLDILAYVPRLDDHDWLSVVDYLLLQDRVEPALADFAKVDRSRVRTPLQYDYVAAYLDFYRADPEAARAIAQRYADYPVERWRSRFREVLAQADEATGLRGPGEREGEGELAATEPSLELAVEAHQVTLHYRNLERCQVSYYRMDVELLFSTQPFAEQESGSFAYVRPNRSEQRDLPAGQSGVTFALPPELDHANVLVEVRGGGLVRRQAYYANALNVELIESFGQVRVTDRDSGAPLPAVYVKVFARLPGGGVVFHKDGYTDLRGRFDYASVSGEGHLDAERFALLVLSEDKGAVIREVGVPRR